MNPEIHEQSCEDDPNRLQADWIVAYENHIVRGGPAPESFPGGLSEEDQQRLDDARRAIDKLQLASAKENAIGEQSATESPPQQLGDFRILHQIGRGGMGVVYEAEQISMGRRVALKILPLAAMLDEKRLERFKNEVRAAATLDHPHCVPVYAVGEERGVHYYAMKLIRGQSMADVIEELQHRDTPTGASVDRVDSPQPTNGQSASHQCDGRAESSSVREITIESGASVDQLSLSRTSRKRDYFRRIAALGAQAAEALHHAHDQGVVHRDIKPGNLLLDSSGKLWVTDFGLARIEADAGLTMTGDVLGTLRYMSPEQALGKRALVDHRVDVYSLGATLYELITLQPAIKGDDRAQILKQFAESEPTAPRKLDPSIPVELETIVRKAIETVPIDRYATAAELAEDLRRFLAHEPIRAKRSTMTGRTVKWVRRYPVLTALIAVAILAAASVAGLSLRHARELALVNTDLSDSLSESEQLRGAAEVQESQMRRAKYLVDMRLANRSMMDGLVDSARTRLQQYLPPSQFAEDRDFPWYYLWQKCLEATKTFRGHTGLVRSSVVAPKAGLVISGGDDETVRLFDLQTQKQLTVLAGFAGKVNAVAVTPDEQTLFTASEEGELLAWNMADVTDSVEPTEIARLEGHADDVLCLSVSPDGKYLASAGADGDVLVWELPAMRQVSRLEGHTDWVRCLDFSPDGTTLASISHDDYLIFWDLLEATEKRRIKIVEEVHPLGLSVRFHPSGKFVAAGSSHNKVRMIRLRDSETVSKFEVPASWMRTIDFSDDGQLLAVAGSNPFIRLIRVDSQMQMTPFKTLPGHEQETWCVRFVDGKRSLLSSGIDGTTVVRKFAASEDATERTISYLRNIGNLTPELIHRRLTTTRDHNYVLLAGKHAVRLFDVVDLQDPIDISISQKADFYGGAISSDSRWVGYLKWRSIGFKATERLHRPGYLRTGPGNADEFAFETQAFHPSKDVMAVGVGKGQLLVVKVPSKEKIAEIRPFGEMRIIDVLFTSDGRFVAACFSDVHDPKPATVVVWDAESFAEYARIEGVERLLAVSSEGCRFALVNLDQSIRIWNVDTQSTEAKCTGHTEKVISGDFSPDGKYLITSARSGPIKLWSTDTGQLVLDIDHNLRLPQIVFGPDYSAFATDIEILSHEPKLDYRHRLVPLLEQHSATDAELVSD